MKFHCQTPLVNTHESLFLISQWHQGFFETSDNFIGAKELQEKD